MRNDKLREILDESRIIAVVGMSRNPHKAAHQVPVCMAELGFEIIPVNPYAEKIMGRRCYPSLGEIPEEVDVVEVFRPSKEALQVVKDALARREERGDVRLIWLQSGIYNEAARLLAKEAGVPFVQSRCMAVEVPALLPSGPSGGGACAVPEDD
jgi:hypothetical protein